MKADKSATILPGEGFHVPICSIHKDDAVEIEPRREAPDGFIHNHVKNIDKDIVFIQNMASEPITIKKNTPLCQIKEMKPVQEKMKEKRVKTTKKVEKETNSVSMISIDPGNQLTERTKIKIKEIIKNYEEIFKNDLPGYNNAFGKI